VRLVRSFTSFLDVWVSLCVSYFSSFFFFFSSASPSCLALFFHPLALPCTSSISLVIIIMAMSSSLCAATQELDKQMGQLIRSNER
jgi:hypothetical protein